MKRILVMLSLVLMLAGCSAGSDTKTKVLTNDEWFGVVESIQTEMELPAMMALSDTELTDFLGINAENLESFVVMMPMMNVHATEIMVFQAKEGKLETVQEEVGLYLEGYEQMWSTYLPDQYELVKNRVEKVVGDSTLVVIIAEDTAAIEAKIDAALAE
ncbi:MAG: DUF4358 domain-containing protein [Erysipelotrichaceae bacterium]|nr:DUF4358 domain-containing protein [Erysipelotrichaceae bacterium]MBQ4343295.1 DUF4358 domain-containing protein [Erysipelotrichaceae bacterium]